MPEGVVYEGRGAPKTGPVEWVKRKLRERYTTQGRMEKEFRKLEKISGPLTAEQKAQAVEKMSLEGRIKSKVVLTVLKDAVGGALVATGASLLIARPDIRANLSASFGAGTKIAGESLSGSLDKTIRKLKPVGGKKPGFFQGLLLSTIGGAQTLTEKSTAKASSLFQKGTQASLRSMEGRVANAGKIVENLTAKAGAKPTETVAKTIEYAQKHLGVLESRQARSQLVTEAVKDIPDFVDVGKSGLQFMEGARADKNRIDRPNYPRPITREVAKAARVAKGEGELIAAVAATQEALEVAKSAGDVGKISAAQEAYNKAYDTRRAFGSAAREKAVREAEKLAKQVKATPTNAS